MLKQAFGEWSAGRDLVDAGGPDDLRDLLSLARQHLGLAQLGDDLLGAAALAGHDALPS
jgi:hypothetical protein